MALYHDILLALGINDNFEYNVLNTKLSVQLSGQYRSIREQYEIQYRLLRTRDREQASLNRMQSNPITILNPECSMYAELMAILSYDNRNMTDYYEIALVERNYKYQGFKKYLENLAKTRQLPLFNQ